MPEALMSTVDSSLPRLPATGTVRTLASSIATSCLTAVRAAAFWATIPLPLIIVGSLLTGVVATAPLFVVGLVVLNVLCAAIGHEYSPER
ncbi:hypothetical protein [Haloarcula pellucida]|uniref:Uncharacterized protein n=1 Tax=Haloarcula pellucida TaxID=1427151 RepID=A0A830GM88_9EURY|nr:hypothetical protein [Halomicroarcula pellucida]MBX0349860.1 hypothetical protein [Halomicroarcula pellucida]GGN94701.1 hypothetical protein GCM10009030_21300 [Halomicroarcula pellucida]